MARFASCKNLSNNTVYINMDNVLSFRQVAESEKGSEYKGKDIIDLCVISEPYHIYVFGSINDLYINTCF